MDRTVTLLWGLFVWLICLPGWITGIQIPSLGAVVPSLGADGSHDMPPEVENSLASPLSSCSLVSGELV